MYILVCRESGLDCDFVIEGETMEEFLKNGADHAMQKHGMHPKHSNAKLIVYCKKYRRS